METNTNYLYISQTVLSNQTNDAPANSKESFSSYDKKTSNRDATIDIYGSLIHLRNLIKPLLASKFQEDSVFLLRRHPSSMGSFQPHRFVDRASGTLCDQITLNPTRFVYQSFEDFVQTLTILIARQYEYHHSINPKRRGKSNSNIHKEMRVTLARIGIITSPAHHADGTKDHKYPIFVTIEGSNLDCLIKELNQQGWDIIWQDYCEKIALFLSYDEKNTTSVPQRHSETSCDTSKTRHTCPNCQQNAWAKLTAQILCGALTCKGTRMLPHIPSGP